MPLYRDRKLHWGSPWQNQGRRQSRLNRGLGGRETCKRENGARGATGPKKGKSMTDEGTGDEPPGSHSAVVKFQHGGIRTEKLKNQECVADQFNRERFQYASSEHTWKGRNWVGRIT